MLKKYVNWLGIKNVEYAEKNVQIKLKENQVLIDNKFSMISVQTESKWLTSTGNHKVLGTTFPFIPGYSAAGYVKEVGSAVSNIKIGDKVVGAPLYGSHSNLVIVDADKVYKLDNSIMLDDAVFFNLGMTGLYSLYNAHLQLGESILLVGQGVVGQSALQGAVASGLHPIVTADVDQHARKISIEMGADDTFDPTNEEDTARISKKYGSFKATIDMSGSNAGMNLAIHFAKKFGRVVLCTGGISGMQPLNYEEIALKCLTLRGDFVNGDMPLQQKCINDYLWLLSKNKICAPDHKNSIYSPKNAKDIYQRILNKDKTVGHPVFKW